MVLYLIVIAYSLKCSLDVCHSVFIEIVLARISKVLIKAVVVETKRRGEICRTSLI